MSLFRGSIRWHFMNSVNIPREIAQGFPHPWTHPLGTNAHARKYDLLASLDECMRDIAERGPGACT